VVKAVSRQVCDVLVIGGGIVGATTAYFLAREPSFMGRVLVLEQDPAYSRAATALSAASIRQQFSSEVNVHVSRFGIEFLRGAAEALATGDSPVDIGLVERSYLYLATPAGRAALEANVRLQERLGVAVELADPDALSRRYPWLDVTGLATGSYTHAGEGWFDAFALLQAVRRKARALGVEFRQGRVLTFDTPVEGTIRRARLADGSPLEARWFVCAAGTRVPQLVGPVGVELPVAPRKRTVFVFDSPAQIVNAPLVIDPSGLWFRPEGRSWLCGLPPVADPDVEPDDFTPDGTSFEQHAWPVLAARVPQFEAARCTREWVGHYDYNAFDHNAFVGHVPAASNLLIASGFSGHGLQQAPAVGRGLAELIVHGRYTSLDLGPLGYQRYLEHRPLREANVI
jgi:FAD-dependent oxidoreductase domain-containing protein 1